jgi:hypothetical protein
MAEAGLNAFMHGQSGQRLKQSPSRSRKTRVAVEAADFNGPYAGVEMRCRSSAAPQAPFIFNKSIDVDMVIVKQENGGEKKARALKYCRIAAILRARW